MAAANFVYIFASADDVHQGVVKPPLHALCTEDLGFAAQELTDADATQCAELAPFNEWMFALVPAEEELGGCGFRFCAETAALRSHWAATLKRSKCASLGAELHSARVECGLKAQELRELKRVLAETLRRSWSRPSQEESEASTRVQAVLRGHLARQASGKLEVAAAPDPKRTSSMTKAVGGLTHGAAGLLGSAGAGLKVAAVGLASAPNSGAELLKGAASGLTHATDGPLRSVDSGLKMVARGLMKGAESVKGGVVYAFEGGNPDDSSDQAASPFRPSTPRGADKAAPGEPPRTSRVATSARKGGGSSGNGGDVREAATALHERGEKLETLKSMVDGLAVNSEALAANAHRLKEQQR